MTASLVLKASLMIEARGDVAGRLRQTSKLMRCEEWFGHSSLHLFFVFCFPYFCRAISISPQAPWLYSIPHHHFLQAQQCFLQMLRIISRIYLILQPARAGLFWEEIPIWLGKRMLDHNMSGKDARWDSGSRSPVEWILYHKDTMFRRQNRCYRWSGKAL